MKDKQKERGFGWLILFVIIGGAVGMMVSMASHTWQDKFPAGTVTHWLNTYVAMDWMWMAALIFAIGYPLVTYAVFQAGFQKAKLAVEREDEEVDEGQMATSIGMAGVYFPIAFVLFTLGMKGMLLSDVFRPWVSLALMVGLIGGNLLAVVVQKKMIQNIKVLYPEKRGDVYSLRFQKDWLDSMDEREKLTTYRASYYAYRAVQWMLFAGLVGTAVYGVARDAFGWLFIMMLLNLVPNVVYIHHVQKQDG